MSGFVKRAAATAAPAPSVTAREPTAVSADGSRVHVEAYGPDGAPAVVLAHGWTCSARVWAAQIRELAAGHRVIAYDQRGHGRTPAVAGAGHSTEALADDLEAVLAAAPAPGERAVLAGHSMGGMTLMAAASRPRFVEHAAAALLCSTGSSRLVAGSLVVPVRAGAFRTRLTRAILGSRTPLGPVTPVSRRIPRYATMAPGTAPERVAECARIVHACPRPTRVAWAHVLAALDLDAGVREMRLPTAVVSGTADRLTPIGHARALAASLPDCAGLVELAGTGHMTPVEAPEAVTAEIRKPVEAHLRREAAAGREARTVRETPVRRGPVTARDPHGARDSSTPRDPHGTRDSSTPRDPLTAPGTTGQRDSVTVREAPAGQCTPMTQEETA